MYFFPGTPKLITTFDIIQVVDGTREDVVVVTDDFFKCDPLGVGGGGGGTLTLFATLQDYNFSSNIFNLGIVGCWVTNPATGEVTVRFVAIGGDILATNDIPIVIYKLS